MQPLNRVDIDDIQGNVLRFDNLKTNMQTENNTESKLKEDESRI